jgi:hypothetical protein
MDSLKYLTIKEAIPNLSFSELEKLKEEVIELYKDREKINYENFHQEATKLIPNGIYTTIGYQNKEIIIFSSKVYDNIYKITVKIFKENIEITATSTACDCRLPNFCYGRCLRDTNIILATGKLDLCQSLRNTDPCKIVYTIHFNTNNQELLDWIGLAIKMYVPLMSNYSRLCDIIDL